MSIDRILTAGVMKVICRTNMLISQMSPISMSVWRKGIAIAITTFLTDNHMRSISVVLQQILPTCHVLFAGRTYLMICRHLMMVLQMNSTLEFSLASFTIELAGTLCKDRSRRSRW